MRAEHSIPKGKHGAEVFIDVRFVLRMMHDMRGGRDEQPQPGPMKNLRMHGECIERND